MAVTPSNWIRLRARVTAVSVDSAGFDHRYDLECFGEDGTSTLRENVAPFRRPFPPPILLTPAAVGEEGVLSIGPDGVERFSLDTIEGITPKSCDDGGTEP